MGVTHAQITEEQAALMRRMMDNRLSKGVKVMAFGSRIKGTAKTSSDMDLVALGVGESKEQIWNLREDFEESSLPFRVELHIWEELPPEFHSNITSHWQPFWPLTQTVD